MLVYKAAYVWDERHVHAEVVDFPGVSTFGFDLNSVRRALADALVDMAETNLLRGEALPLPNPDCEAAPEAELTEPIYLLLQASTRIAVVAVDPVS